MWKISMRMVPSLLCAAVCALCVAVNVASTNTVKGTVGDSVTLPPGIATGPSVTVVVWRQTSPRTKIAEYLKDNIEYFSSDKYKARLTLHRSDFSLEIRDLRREDAGDYEVTFTKRSGAEESNTVRLEVSGDGAQITGWTAAVVLGVVGSLLLSCSG